MQPLSPAEECELDRELVARGGLYQFIQLAWPQVETSVKFLPGWHLEEVCKHLEAVSRGECKRLIINIPPGCTKSLTVSVFWPVWDWIVNPWRRFMFASFDATLSQRDALRSKELLRSHWFQSRWGLLADPERLLKLGVVPVAVVGESRHRGKKAARRDPEEKEAQNTASVFWTTSGGLRFSSSVEGKSTGWHSHIQVVDDPLKPKDVEAGGAKARNAMERAYDWWKNTMATRHADPKTFARVIIMQRLHEADLAGRCIEEGGWTHLRLPMEFEPDNKCETPWGGDRRAQASQLLWPERFPAEVVTQVKKDMGPMISEAQYQQNPSPPGGAIFKRDWLAQRWKQLSPGGRFILSCDCTFDDTEGSDFVSLQLWYYLKSNFYLVERRHDRMTIVGTLAAIRDMKRVWPRATLLVEKKANGPAVRTMLKDEIPGIVMFEPSDSKEARAIACTPFFAAGNVWLPEKPWVGDYVEQLAKFPKARHDDDVDATSQALLHLAYGSTGQLQGAMARLLAEG